MLCSGRVITAVAHHYSQESPSWLKCFKTLPQARAHPPRLSPLHDPAESPRTSDGGSPDENSGENGIPGRKGHPGKASRKGGGPGGEPEKQEGPDAAHFVGFPQKPSLPKAKDAVTYQLLAAAEVDSFVEGDGKVILLTVICISTCR